MLTDDHFLRIHRSYMVAQDKIDSFSHSHVEIGGKELPIGRRYKLEMERVLKRNLFSKV